jgi:holo-[acyl-carrier protein] synthase
MIYGTGIDIIEIARIKRSLETYASHFEDKIFTPSEIDYCRSKADPSRHFAARFAAKEAVLKSLGTGMSQGLSWKNIEVVSNPETGKPSLLLNGRGKELFAELQLKAIHISISHEKAYAIAHAIAEL